MLVVWLVMMRVDRLVYNSAGLMADYLVVLMADSLALTMVEYLVAVMVAYSVGK
jgi:hypothetical protein